MVFVFVAKGGDKHVRLYGSLQRHFEIKPEHIQDLKTEVNQTHKELSARLEKEDRWLLLKLVGLEDALRGETTLHSFVSGFPIRL